MAYRRTLVLALVLPLFTLAGCDEEQPSPVSPEATISRPDSTSGQDSLADLSSPSSADLRSREEYAVEGYRDPPDAIGTGWIVMRGQPAEVTYEVHDGLAVFEGDIILGPPDEVAETRAELDHGLVSRGVAIDGSGNHYPDGEIAYEISSDFNADGEKAIEDAIELVERSTAGIDFHERDGESDYVLFQTGSGCSSHVGFDGGKDPVNLSGAGSCGVGSNAHEMLHRLGQWHEQSRCDRDDFINVHFDRIQDDREHNFEKECSGSTDYAQYEDLSLMHYPPWAFQDSAANADGLNTITAADPSVDEANMGQRDSLALTDIKAMCALYCQHNDPPTAVLGGVPGSSIDEGSSVPFDAGGSTDPDDEFDYFHFAWSFGDGTCGSSPTPAECSDDDPDHIYADDGTYSVSLTVRDGPFGRDITTGMNMGGTSQGFLEDQATATVTVDNVAPDVDAGPDATIDEGDTFSRSGSFTDPGDDTWSATVNYDDGDGEEALTLSGKNFGLNHTYADNGTNTVQVTVTDDDDGEGTDDAVVTVNNVAPSVDAGMDATITSGETFSFSGTFSDPGVEDDPWTWEIDWGDATSPTTGSTSDQSAPITATHQVCSATPAGSNTVTLSVTDKDDGTGTDDLALTVEYLGQDIVIKPNGGGMNSINLRSGGRLPVAILSTATFDATTVDPSAATLGDEMDPDTEVAQRQNGTFFATTEDVNEDGRMDLVLHFEIQALVDNDDLDMSTTELALRAFLDDECTNIRGVDAVTVRP